jgi:hypothetical protein
MGSGTEGSQVSALNRTCRAPTAGPFLAPVGLLVICAISCARSHHDTQAPPDAGSNPIAEPELCAGFLDIAIARTRLAPGNSCFGCPINSNCSQPTECEESFARCMQAYCLCDEEVSGCRAENFPEDLCACIDLCLPPGRDSCMQAYRNHMQCVVDSCSATCLK